MLQEFCQSLQAAAGRRGRAHLAPHLTAPHPFACQCRRGARVRRGGSAMMNYFRTAILLAGLTALFMGVGYLIGGQAGMLIALLVAGAMNFFTYWNSDSAVLSMNDAQEVDERTAPEFYGLVRELAQRAGLPMPRVYIMQNEQPNAFATGRNPQH